MQIEALLVDWKELQRREKDGTLNRLGNQIGSLALKEKWIEYIESIPDSKCYFEMAEAWDSMNQPDAVSKGTHEKACEVMRHLMPFGEGVVELTGYEAHYLLAISPQTTMRLAKMLPEIDFSAYREEFAELSRQGLLKYLADLLPETPKRKRSKDVTPERIFDEVFLPYVTLWLDLLKRAGAEKKGIIVTFG